MKIIGKIGKHDTRVNARQKRIEMNLMYLQSPGTLNCIADCRLQKIHIDLIDWVIYVSK